MPPSAAGKVRGMRFFQACLLRFRPILMTTLAALFGALPLALGSGRRCELRQPLGITVVGGLLVSQILTLIPRRVIYLFFDRLRRKKPENPPGNPLSVRREMHEN